MKRKNLILSVLLSLSVVICSACAKSQANTVPETTSEITVAEGQVVSDESETIATTITEEETEIETTTTTVKEETEAETTTTTVKEETEAETTTTTVKEETEVETTTTIAKEETEAETTTTVKEETKAETTTTTAVSSKQTDVQTKEEAIVTTENTEKKYIALTFDDGPNTTTTNEVLDVIEQYDIKASFFLVGNNINTETEKVVKRAYDMGCEIGNHSKTHSYMNEMDETDIVDEINFVNDYVEKITGEEPKFFRPPYIAVSNTMYDLIDMPFICGFGCNDWDDRVTVERRAQVILRQVQDGGIILLHDAQGNSKTVEALHTIIPELQSQGYEFVTVTELFEIKGVKIKPDDKALYTFVGQ